MKPKLRLFADYCVGHPLWDHADNDKYYINGSDEQLLDYGVSLWTLHLLKAICYVHDWPDSHEPWPEELLTTYNTLIKMCKERLDAEIGHMFDIEVVE